MSLVALWAVKGRVVANLNVVEFQVLSPWFYYERPTTLMPDLRVTKPSGPSFYFYVFVFFDTLAPKLCMQSGER